MKPLKEDLLFNTYKDCFNHYYKSTGKGSEGHLNPHTSNLAAQSSRLMKQLDGSLQALYKVKNKLEILEETVHTHLMNKNRDKKPDPREQEAFKIISARCAQIQGIIKSRKKRGKKD